MVAAEGQKNISLAIPHAKQQKSMHRTPPVGIKLKAMFPIQVSRIHTEHWSRKYVSILSTFLLSVRGRGIKPRRCSKLLSFGLRIFSSWSRTCVQALSFGKETKSSILVSKRRYVVCSCAGEGCEGCGVIAATALIILYVAPPHLIPSSGLAQQHLLLPSSGHTACPALPELCKPEALSILSCGSWKKTMRSWNGSISCSCCADVKIHGGDLPLPRSHNAGNGCEDAPHTGVHLV